MRTSQHVLLRVALTAALSLPVTVFGQSVNSELEDARAAIRAVQATLPSVAILGQKQGPADTTEVFIQVPGVLNMQSVYVLSDKATVISGVVVPPIENGFPGSQLGFPSGEATVDPRAPRSNLADMNGLLGITPPTSAPISQTESRKNADIPAKAPVVTVPAPSSNVAVATRKAPTADASEPLAPSPAPSSAAASGTIDEAGVVETASRSVDSATPSSDGAEPIVIESLDQVASSTAFGRIVGTVLQNDVEIERVRSTSGESGQQRAYLDLVRSLPAIVQGSSDRKIYVMFDPNCPVCHRYYNDVALEVAAGQLEIHWIPAIVFPDERSSLTASAALLAELDRTDGDPATLLRNVMTQADYTQAIDGAPKVDRLVPYMGDVVKNTAVMAMARAETPLVIFENRDGNLAINPGIPRPGYTALVKRGS